MTPMMWLSIIMMILGAILWISSIDNQINIIQEAMDRGEFLFLAGLIFFIIEQWIIPAFKFMYMIEHGGVQI